MNPSAAASASVPLPVPPGADRPPRPSASLLLVRDGPDGLEVLMMQRAERGDHNSSAWVFPGGLTDPADRDADPHASGLDDAVASLRLGLPERGLDYYLAAVRECFEEAGLLLAEGAASAADSWAGWRAVLQRGERPLAAFCEATGMRLALGELHYLSHWVTPPGRLKRFDTRFFLARAPQGQRALHDGSETTAHRWLRPAEALADSSALKLLTPTRGNLALLARHATVDALMAWAAAPREVVQIMPCIGRSQRGERPVTPDEHAYAELLHLDPQRRGHAWCELVPGQAVRLSARVIRVTANNGSMMTGPGTNTYLIGPPDEAWRSADASAATHAGAGTGAGAGAGGPGAGSGDRPGPAWAVIDPGPADPAHVEAVLAAAPGPIRWIFVTHTHPDHSPAALLLQARTGAQLLGRVAAHPQWQDASFVPGQALQGGECFELVEAGPGSASVDARSSLRVIHTPGHASNHLCYLLEQERMLFTGDHVMQSSTVVINPPDGDMAAYLQSLRALMPLESSWIAPGHGFLMDRPRAAMQAIVEHRLRREAKVRAALAALGPADARTLLQQVYADVPERLHGMALRSLSAHLLKLESEGLCRQTPSGWV